MPPNKIMIITSRTAAAKVFQMKIFTTIVSYYTVHIIQGDFNFVSPKRLGSQTYKIPFAL